MNPFITKIEIIPMMYNAGSKYIIPTLLENDLKQSLFIEQIMVVGEGEKMPGAIIQPNFEFIRDWIDHKNHSIGKTEKEIATSVDDSVDFAKSGDLPRPEDALTQVFAP